MYIRHIIFAAVIVLVAGYFFYEAKEVILAPGLEILEPVNGATLEASVMRVVGKTRPKLAVWAGGRIFTSNEEGNFEGELPLSPGYNQIGFSVKDRFGNETKKVLQVFVK
ncbi:hypothetical protein A2W54_01335 [Candidatus Giovannonibacteria bacterium RIFCSPHIGHO2_02_43_13]|uniref:Bacterial Ig domain-containing protein n=1 Tax=Candidatus Giovannonibacteria bacterium RIFCSPHIGHO2_02_43_13 TaxID=1798330 RepID=A0A1F5WUN2_9BACT|nr:MAG: hypothetical protein UW28_C0001G0025 [Parcubacteria group bacterium GW2011_GWA2_44_13]OGF72957.1 MAG: hypothetical protein A3E06_03180 [Candidatus Giovannonibacteria bacterium RIFCSPHIGHO2_12_FULL_44_42]OGF79358.1 MAG: hypothetical protein A2W54_01335 [Candidatus Giovannonibacteria bacterium RIFCSPHIGHO2_02_43_13]OGF90405.1 MAG: hypothetical protein A3I94_00570 [Candidatus Giovannonibacteria bacterium RIFCSPLOWO2_02_FULL_43_54]OGF97217.1 MAG: hypothetical protein A3H08_03610 [Candidatus